MDSDRILVMDNGSASEYDIPHVLLRKPKSLLREMVEATGSDADSLKKIAQDAFGKMQKRLQMPQDDWRSLAFAALATQQRTIE